MTHSKRFDLPLALYLSTPFSIVYVGRVLPGLVAQPLKQISVSRIRNWDC